MALLRTVSMSVCACATSHGDGNVGYATRTRCPKTTEVSACLPMAKGMFEHKCVDKLDVNLIRVLSRFQTARFAKLNAVMNFSLNTNAIDFKYCS